MVRVEHAHVHFWNLVKALGFKGILNLGFDPKQIVRDSQAMSFCGAVLTLGFLKFLVGAVPLLTWGKCEKL